MKRFAAWQGAALALCLSACGTPSGTPERIVLVVVDTLRADHLSPYAAHVATPHAAALAERGQVFPNAFASFHQTTMSMASLFTGRTPSLETGARERALDWTGGTWCGLRRLAADAQGSACLPVDVPTLAEGLRSAGYWTAGIATNALLFRPAGYDRGFERWIEVGGGRGSGFALSDPLLRSGNRANEAVARALSERPQDRFFLYVHYMDVHDFAMRGIGYREAVEATDRTFGALLELLHEQGLLEGAVVVLASDHGERFEELHLVEGKENHKGNPSFEEVLHVPLVIAPPVVDDPERPLRGDDLYRLLLRVAGVEVPDRTDLEPGELFVSELRWQTYRRGRWKSYRERAGGALRLVDLGLDPGERRDVADAHPEVAGAHARRMDALTGALATRGAGASRLSEEDERRLRALGYLD